jgi:O-antigen ligase
MLGWLALAPFSRVLNLTMGRGLPDLGLHRVAALFLLSLLLAQLVTGRRRLARFTPIEALGGLFILALLLSVPSSHMGIVSGVQSVFDNAALPVLCAFFAANLLTTQREQDRLAVVLALLGALLGLVAAREQLTNQPILSPIPYRWAYGLYSIKVTSFFGAPAIMAFTLLMTAPVTLFSLARARTPSRQLFFAVAFAAIIAGLVLTYVRAGWLAAAVALVVLIILAPGMRRFALLLAPVILLAALLFASGLFDTRALNERLQSEGSIAYRTGALEVGLQIARSAPILGLGFDNYSDTAIAAGWQPKGELGLPSVAAHNLFLYVLTSAGLVGLLPLVVLLVWIAWRAFGAWRSARGTARGWPAVVLATLAGYLIFANTFDALGAQLANMLFFTLAGAVIGGRGRMGPSVGPDRPQHRAEEAQP